MHVGKDSSRTSSQLLSNNSGDIHTPTNSHLAFSRRFGCVLCVLFSLFCHPLAFAFSLSPPPPFSLYLCVCVCVLGWVDRPSGDWILASLSYSSCSRSTFPRLYSLYSLTQSFLVFPTCKPVLLSFQARPLKRSSAGLLYSSSQY